MNESKTTINFEQHGDYKIWQKGQVIFAELSGAWNKEAAENFKADFENAMRFVQAPWGHLVYLDQWELCGGDVFPIIESLVENCINNGLTRAANVYQDSSMKSQFLNKMVVEEQGSFKRSVFDNKQDAIDWLTSEGFQCE